MDLKNFIESKTQTNLLIDDVRKWNESIHDYASYSNQYYQEISERLNNKDIYLAILGEQGAGKSTLGNVLLSGKNIFPMDVAETTNCLTFVAGIKEEKEEFAEIIFESRRPEKGPLSHDFLRPYVDEQENQDNNKGVKEIRCYVHVEWLEKAGVWLVDTPGVQSLTQRNHDLTFQFLPKITAAIYLSRANPPITDTEMIFLKTIWENRPLMFFAMNRYDGEAEEDVNDSKEYTLNALNELFTEDDVMPALYTIEVGRAYEAFEEEDPDEIDEELKYTGAKDLTENISVTLEKKLNQSRILSALQKLEILLKEKMKTLSSGLKTMEQDIKLSKDQINEDQCRKNESYIKFTRQFKDEINIKKDEFISFHDSALNEIDSKIEQVRSDMIEYIDDEKMNTKHFQNQFKIVCKEYLEPPFESDKLKALFKQFIYELGDLFDEYINELEEISDSTIDKNIEFKKHNGFDAAKKVESEDFLKGAGFVLNALGYIRMGGVIAEVGAALWAGGAVLVAAEALTAAAFAESLAAVWASLSLLGPVGWGIAAVVTVFGFVGGRFFKNWAKKREKEKLKNGVNDALKEVEKNLKDYLTDSKNNVSGQLDQVFLDLEDKMYYNLQESIKSIKELEKSLQERQPIIEAIKNQLKIGKKFITQCEIIQENL